MSLRLQLLAVSLLTLALPWAGWRYVTEMESALRRGLEQSLLASAVTIASALDRPGALFPPSPAAHGTIDSTVYAHPLNDSPLIDGNLDDWNVADGTGPQDLARELGPNQLYWAAVRDRYAYLFLRIFDDNLVYQSAPGQTPYGDRVLLGMGGDGQTWLLLQTAAPGTVRAQRTAPNAFIPTAAYEDRMLAAWVETVRGYAVEARIPLELIGGRLGIAIIDVDHADPEPAVELSATWDVGGQPPGPFLHRTAAVQAAASQFDQAGRRLRIVDANGWVLYDAGSIDEIARPIERLTEQQLPTLSETLLRFVLRREDPLYRELEQPAGFLADAELRGALTGRQVARWYQRGLEASAIVAAAVPLTDDTGVRAAVLLEQGSDSILTLTNDALVRLMIFTLFASLLAAGALLGYATLLSFRVRALARAAETALSPRGEIAVTLPGQRARDELGDLSRSFADLLGRLRAYTDYLRTLKGKLAHELRTPLAVVSTSLDNMEREPRGADLTPYLQRIRQGSNRLDAIIDAMSEAAAIEQAVVDVTPELFDLAPVVESCVAAYRDVYAQRTFDLAIRADHAAITGSPDLIAQLLDKLIDNAVSFSSPGSVIGVGLERQQDQVCLSVRNPGPPLPSTMRSQLFDSLVSVRKGGGERRHLGLGLYIAALIARLHKGRIDADNLADGRGVVFRVSLPLAGRAAPGSRGPQAAAAARLPAV